MCYTESVMQKIYCFVDESGQDTEGRLFIVSLLVTSHAIKDELERKLLAIEEESGKKTAKWHVASFHNRMKYLEQIVRLPLLHKSLFYSTHQSTKAYSDLTTYSIARAINLKTEKEPNQSFIFIDGFSDAECRKVKKGLHLLNIRYKKVRGVTDESNAFIRLADALAGFLRDCFERQSYTKPLLQQFTSRQILTNLSDEQLK